MLPRVHSDQESRCAQSVALAAAVVFALLGVSRAVTVFDPGRPVELAAQFDASVPPDKVLAALGAMDGWRAILPARMYGILQVDPAESRDGHLVFAVPQLPLLSRAQVTSFASQSAVELALAVPSRDGRQSMTNTPLAALRIRVDVRPSNGGSRLVIRSNQPLPAPMAARLHAEVTSGFRRLMATVSGN